MIQEGIRKQRIQKRIESVQREAEASEARTVSQMKKAPISVRSGNRQEKGQRSSLSYEKIKDRIIFQLIPYQRNRKLLQEVLHQRYLDLAVVFGYLFPSEEKKPEGAVQQAILLIQQETFQSFGIPAEELAAKAYENTPVLQGYQVQKMDELLQEANGEEAEARWPEAKILTNRDWINGAATILYPGLLSQLAEEAGTDFILLPSSRHEVILLPVFGEIRPKERRRECLSDFCEMVQEANRTVLEEQEILSEQAYFYDRQTDRILSPSGME